MRGSAAEVEMSGNVDLAQETQSLRVRVVPSLGDTRLHRARASSIRCSCFPAAIAQRILKDPLGHIFAFDYAVTGGWADPKVERIGVATRGAERRRPRTDVSQ